VAIGHQFSGGLGRASQLAGGVFEGDRLSLVAECLDLRQQQRPEVVRRAVPRQAALSDEPPYLRNVLAQDASGLGDRDPRVVDHPGLPEQQINRQSAGLLVLIGHHARSLARIGAMLRTAKRRGKVTRSRVWC
jgi:hypothetical protein